MGSFTTLRRSAVGAFALQALMTCQQASSATGPALTSLTATAEDAVTAGTNPAGLARLRDTEWVGELHSFVTDSKFEVSAGDLGRSSSDDSSETLFVPAIFHARPWTERTTLGVSLMVPGGIGSNPGDDSPGRYLLKEWNLGVVSLSPAIGYRVNPRWSVGAALNVNYTSYSYEAAVLNGLTQPDGAFKLEDSDLALGWQVGVLYEPTERTRLGLSYRSSHESGFSDQPEFSGLSPEREAALRATGIFDARVDLNSKIPQLASAGLFHTIADGVDLSLDVAWIDFSEFGLKEALLGATSIAVPERNYRDIWGASVGLRVPVTDRWKGRVGFAYLSAGVDDLNRSFALRLDRVVGVGIGGEYAWDRELAVGFNVQLFGMGDAPVSRDVPVIGRLEGSYSSNRAIGLDLFARWRRR